MNKQEFISALRERLACLPAEELDERINFYSEMIDDKIEDGFSEEEAVAQIGTAEEIAEQIIADTPLSSFVKKKIKPKRQLTGGELLLIILTFPLWLPLLISAISVVISLYAVIWSGIISLWAVFVSIAACAICGVLGGIGFICGGFALSGVATLGGGLICAGLSIFGFFGCRAASVGTVKLTKKVILALKKRFALKEGV